MTAHTGGLNGAEVRDFLSGHIYVAPVGTALPTDTTTAVPSPFAELGYTTDSGVDLNPTITSNGIKSWQSRQPLRYVVTEFGMEMKFELLQRHKDSMFLAFGGGSVAAGTGSDWVFTPPASSAVYERAVVIEAFDGAIIDRWCFERCGIVTLGTIKISATTPTSFPVTITNLAPADGTVGWTHITNDPAENTD